MGKLPAEVIRKKSVRRGNHPLDSFSAVGPEADYLICTQNYTDVYRPIRALIDHNGLLVLIGVGLNRMTALHLAEQRAGRNLFVRWALNTNGRPCTVNTGGCSEGFPRLQPLLQKLRRSVHVHSAELSIYAAREALETAVSAIRRGAPTKCDDAACLRCADAAAGGPYIS
jgi:aminoglycoside 3-N-acetyltransferase